MLTVRALMVLGVVASSSAALARTVVFMNRAGGIYDPAPADDSRLNRSSLLKHTSVVPPFAGSDADWQAVLTCMRTLFAPFNLDITDQDPGDSPHLECVTGGHPEDAGFPPNYGGVGTLATCGTTVPNAVVFTFAEAWGGDPQMICETAAQELGHTFGLDHVLSCPDPMSYQYGCGAKVFVDDTERCGEYTPRACRCGGTTQNGYAMLRELVGERQAPRAARVVGPPETAAFTDEGKADSVGAGAGSGCQIGGGASAPGAWLLLALVAALVARRLALIAEARSAPARRRRGAD